MLDVFRESRGKGPEGLEVTLVYPGSPILELVCFKAK